MKRWVIVTAVVIGSLVFAGTGLLLVRKSSKPDTTQPPTLISLQSTTSPDPQKNTCSIASGTVKVPRDSAEGAFSSPITDINQIAVITSGKFVGDSRFTYLQIKEKQRVPVYAPADGTLTKIAYKTRADLPTSMSQPDYDLTFLVDCHTMYRLNHITDPNPNIVALSPTTEPLHIGKGYAAPSEKDTEPKAHIMVRAGEQLGTTTGTPAAHNWDFGVFVDNASKCPYEQFHEPLRSTWLALFGDTTKPIPGTTCEVSGNF